MNGKSKFSALAPVTGAVSAWIGAVFTYESFGSQRTRHVARDYKNSFFISTEERTLRCSKLC